MKPTKKAKCRELWRGLCLHPRRSCGYTFAAFGVLWTLIDSITFLQNIVSTLLNIEIKNRYTLIIVLLVSLFFCVRQLWKPSSVIIKVATTNTKIEVLFGNLFEQTGLRGIAATEFFESELGTPVSEQSLHGMFLKRYFGGKGKSFDKQLKQQLKGVSSKYVKKVKKPCGKTKSYPIGTTARIKTKCGIYIIFASAETDLKTCKASSDVTKMWTAMHGLWQRARIESGGRPLIIPLIGSGLSGIGLPARDLLNLIILSVITETKVKQITGRIRIVLHPNQFEEIDLRNIKKHWEES